MSTFAFICPATPAFRRFHVRAAQLGTGFLGVFASRESWAAAPVYLDLGGLIFYVLLYLAGLAALFVASVL